ncbi:rhodanese-like domain-containing protein [Ancylomarina sp. 16SWW S1-10-2]|uniref:rhodanese-like domain-containing protein n=1 Tax=Ancylomarina sp. 16SWW S1-10-2 TaxID=2499681 RepID=UPI0012AE88CA|nr:rhodanese-like domain-containing protein [Ancylomarina sp. 16SWW S1-10-2]MRT92375.1 rhodanese-like domain-containing protein [Ancylomarina sp. 16SWW S1-10-2]
MGVFFNDNNAPKTSYTPSELVSEMKKREDILLIDIRESHELAQGGIENALHIPIGQIPEKMGTLPKNKDLVVFCHEGLEGKQVRNYLKKGGFFKVAYLKGGFTRWKKEVAESIIA